MTDGSRPSEIDALIERIEGQLALARRSDELANDRTLLAEIHAGLRVDEKSLQLDASALRGERDDLQRQVGEARKRLASLDEAIAAGKLDEAERARALDVARDRLERVRGLTRQLEREIFEYREQMSAAQERLGDLVKSVLRMQHKIWSTSDKPVEMDS